MTEAAKKISLIDKWKAVGRATTDARLNNTDACVFFRLLFHHNSKTDLCFPSQETLADALNTSARTIRSSIKKLEQSKYLKKLGQRSGGGSNRYALNIIGAEDFFQAGGKKFPEQRKKSTDDTMKEKRKETGKSAGEGKESTKLRGPSPKPPAPPSRNPGEFQAKLVKLFGGIQEGWDVLMEVPSDLLEELEAAYLAEDMETHTARDRILKHLSET